MRMRTAWISERQAWIGPNDGFDEALNALFGRVCGGCTVTSPRLTPGTNSD